MRILVLVFASWVGESLHSECTTHSLTYLKKLWASEQRAVSTPSRVLAMFIMTLNGKLAWPVLSTEHSSTFLIKHSSSRCSGHPPLAGEGTRRRIMHVLSAGATLLSHASLAIEPKKDKLPQYSEREIDLPIRPKKTLRILQQLSTLPSEGKTDLMALADFLSIDRTGAYVWTGGVDLAQGASTGQLSMSIDGSVKPVNLKGKRLLELGCGTGVAGIGALVGGASTALLTDGDPELLQLAQKNVDRNLNGALARRASTRRLRWGNSDDEATVSTAGPFDIILASEVAYTSTALAALFGTIRRFLEEATLAGVAQPMAVLQLPPSTSDGGDGIGGVLEAAQKLRLSAGIPFKGNDTDRIVLSLSRPSI